MTIPTIAQLAEIKVLAPLAQENLQEIASSFSVSAFKKGQTLVTHNERSNSVYFLHAGKVRATMFSPSGRQVSYQDLDSGDMFGEIAAIDKLPRSTHVIALTDGRVLHISGDNFLSLLAKYPAVSSTVMLKMVSLVRFLCERLYEFGAFSVSARVRAELLRLAEQQGVYSEKEIQIKNMPTHEELANRLATHREAVTRELSQLEKIGLIKKQKNELIVLNAKDLAASIE